MKLILALALAAALPTVKEETSFTDGTWKKTGKYTFVTPPPRKVAKAVAKPGLLIYFHPYGGTATYAANFDTLAASAAKWGLATLAIQAPDGNPAWPSNEAPQVHTDYAHALLNDKILSTGGIDRDRLVFVGFSAGSTFLSGDYLPVHAAGMKGGAIMLCGGGPPAAPTRHNTPTLPAGFDARFKLYFYVTEKDFLYQQTLAGISYWKARGASPQLVAPKIGGHCEFDLVKVLEGGLEVVLGKSL